MSAKHTYIIRRNITHCVSFDVAEKNFQWKAFIFMNVVMHSLHIYLLRDECISSS